MLHDIWDHSDFIDAASRLPTEIGQLSALRPTEIVILQRERTNPLAGGCQNGVA